MNDSINQKINFDYLSLSNEKLLSWGLIGKIKRELIIDNKIKTINEPCDEEFKNFKKKWLIQMKLENEKDLGLWLKVNGFSVDYLDIFIKRKWKFFKWIENKFNNYLDSYFLEKKENYDKVSFKIIRVSNKDLANELYLRIKEKEETFENIASIYSEGYEKDNNGSIGPILISKVHPVIREILLASKLNNLNSPINIDKMFVILKLIKRDIAILNEETRNLLLDELGEKYIFEKLQKN